MKHERIQLILGITLVAFAGSAGAQSGERLVVPLSDPGRPAVLEVSAFFGDLSVTGYDGDEIVLVPGDLDDDDGWDWEWGNDDDDEERSREGLRRIPNTSLGLYAEERENTVTVSMSFPRQADDLEIMVPRATSVRVGTANNGDVTVHGVRGEHEFSNMNGDITATDIEGSVVVNTTNGDVDVEFLEIARDRPMSFSSFNGDMDVTFPEDLAATLRISTHRGDVYTDFEFTLRPQPPVVQRDNAPRGRHQVRLERDVYAEVGGGGPEIRFRTFNGDIVIRER